MSVISIRDAKRILRAHGFWIRNSGKHEQWVDAAGRAVSLPHKPVGGVLYGFLAQAIKRIKCGERPAKGRAKREAR